ncbi:MAG: CDP-glycerol glycerophosphotransferase family protein, partial [Streptosporangiaceae bacterium]
RLLIGVGPAEDEAATPAASTAAPAIEVVGGPGPVLTGQAWGTDGTLTLRGRAAGPEPARITLRHLDGWERHEFAVTGSGPEFTAVIDVGAVETFGRSAPLRDGRWEIGVATVPDATVPDATVPDAGSHVAVDGRPVRVGRKTCQCSAEGGRLLLRAGPYLRGYERGRIRRKLLREVYYPIARRLPLRDQVLLMSYAGKQTGDNPRGIADELRRRGDRRRQIWAVADWSMTVPAGADAVLIGSAAYFTALGRSRYLISNDHMPAPMRRRPGQRYAQTWHGTPLKRLGYDIARPSFASGQRYFAFLDHDVAQWDLLLSPDPFATPILRQAFRFGGEIAETGYPRNDALLAKASGPAGAAAGADAGDDRERIRRLIGVPPGRRVALYVPTWRDDTRDAAGGYRLDFRLDLAAAGRRLAGDYVLAIRGHHLMAGGIPAARDGFTLDVTGYPDINDLLAIADVLITDYSSVMFDFAPTGRPMLFFTYDLERYRDQVRGFYFDFEASAPGPLLRTSEEVVEALADIDAVAERYRDAHAEFTARFCPLDDGKASARACDWIFGG